MIHKTSVGSCKQFGKVYKTGAIGEPSAASGVTTAHPDDPGPAAAEEAVGETIHPTAAGAPVHPGPAQAACRQNGNPSGSIRRFYP